MILDHLFWISQIRIILPFYFGKSFKPNDPLRQDMDWVLQSLKKSVKNMVGISKSLTLWKVLKYGYDFPKDRSFNRKIVFL
jgi:hypothetical protein